MKKKKYFYFWSIGTRWIVFSKSIVKKKIIRYLGLQELKKKVILRILKNYLF